MGSTIPRGEEGYNLGLNFVGLNILFSLHPLPVLSSDHYQPQVENIFSSSYDVNLHSLVKDISSATIIAPTLSDSRKSRAALAP